MHCAGNGAVEKGGWDGEGLGLLLLGEKLCTMGWHSEERRSLGGVEEREGNEIGSKGAGGCGTGLR